MCYNLIYNIIIVEKYKNSNSFYRRREKNLLIFRTIKLSENEQAEKYRIIKLETALTDQGKEGRRA